MRLFISIIFLASCIDMISQSVINVPDDYERIQVALDEAMENDTIVVSPGRYFENLVWPTGKDLHLISNKGADSTFIDGGKMGGVLKMEDLTEASLLKGFAIQNGLLRQSDKGAGILAQDCGIELKNLIIRYNEIEGNAYGAGAHLGNYTGRIDSCQFTFNTAKLGYMLEGVGLHLDVNSDVVVSNCLFSHNEGTIENNREIFGAGLFISTRHSQALAPIVIIKNCTYSKNRLESSASAFGAGVYAGRFNSPIELKIDSCQFIENELISERGKGGAISIENRLEMYLTNTTIENNKASQGSGFFYQGFPNLGLFIVVNTSVNENESRQNPLDHGAFHIKDVSDVTVVNSQFSSNQGSSFISESVISSSMNVNVINSTFAFNALPIKLVNTNLSVLNSILWNEDSIEIEEGASSLMGGSISVNNSLIKGGYEGIDNINSNPLFMSEEELIPTENSPCINAGDKSLNVMTDLLGNPRPLPAGTNPDLGAYEVDQQIGSSTAYNVPNRFKIFPNPAQDWIHFSESVKLVKIYNGIGELLKEERHTNAVCVKDLLEGNYTVTISVGSNVQSETLVLIR